MGPEIAWCGGGLSPEEVVVDKFVPSLESLFSLGFEGRSLGCPENFAGMSPTPGSVQEVVHNKFVLILQPPYRNGDSVKMLGPFSEPMDSEIGESQKGTAGRGRQKKCHRNLRQFATFGDNLRHFFDIL